MKKIRIFLCLCLFVLLGHQAQPDDYIALFKDGLTFDFCYYIGRGWTEVTSNYYEADDLSIIKKRKIVACFNACDADVQAWAAWDKTKGGSGKLADLRKALEKATTFRDCVKQLIDDKLVFIQRTKRSGEIKKIRLGTKFDKLNTWVSGLKKELGNRLIESLQKTAKKKGGIIDGGKLEHILVEYFGE